MNCDANGRNKVFMPQRWFEHVAGDQTVGKVSSALSSMLLSAFPSIDRTRCRTLLAMKEVQGRYQWGIGKLRRKMDEGSFARGRYKSREAILPQNRISSSPQVDGSRTLCRVQWGRHLLVGPEILSPHVEGTGEFMTPMKLYGHAAEMKRGPALREINDAPKSKLTTTSSRFHTKTICSHGDVLDFVQRADMITGMGVLRLKRSTMHSSLNCSTHEPDLWHWLFGGYDESGSDLGSSDTTRPGHGNTVTMGLTLTVDASRQPGYDDLDSQVFGSRPRSWPAHIADHNIGYRAVVESGKANGTTVRKKLQEGREKSLE
ncbi:hypothetical protein F5146DRAFT_1001763 [Armillaria mellea]|nr:hypothetical protein F5146DRAFT_1001763 [Armillaria mellea]